MKTIHLLLLAVCISSTISATAESASALVFETVRNGDAAGLGSQLMDGTPVDVRDESGTTLLMRAALAGSEPCLQLLLDHGAEPNAGHHGGVTPLMWAVHDINLVRLLLEKGADPNQVSRLGNSPLILAARIPGNHATVEFLLKRGSNVEQENFSGIRALQASAASADLQSVRLLLAHGAEVNHIAIGGEGGAFIFGRGRSALVSAARQGDEALASLLISKGADVKIGGPLLHASMLGRTGVARLFLERGAQADYKAQSGPGSYPALMWAVADAGGEREELVRLLIEHGANPNMQIARKNQSFMEVPQSAMIWAEQHGDPAILKLLTAAGASRDGKAHRKEWQSKPRAASAFSIKPYPIPGRRAEFDKRIERAANWLRQVRPENNEERIYQLLGLAWAGEGVEWLTTRVKGLLATQRSNGGWAQLEGLESDAYATGQTLYTLLTVGKLKAAHRSIQRGLQFLLATQAPEGSWHVRRRAFPFQPTLRSAFPHGRDAIRFAADLEEDQEMPPLSKRDEYPSWTAKQIANVRKWIDQGAEWPDDVTLDD